MAQQRDNGFCLPQCQTFQSLPIYHWCPSSCHPSTRAQREQVCVGESICGFFKKNCLGLQKFLLTQSLLFFEASNCGDLSSWHWNPGLGGLVWVWDASFLRYPSQIFIPVDTGPACSASVTPTSLDDCGFLAIVVGLPFNLISNVPE